jgi:hypothetical protein
MNQEDWYHHSRQRTQPSVGWVGASLIVLSEISMDTLKWILDTVSGRNGRMPSTVAARSVNPEKEYYYLAVMARDWLRENPKPYVMRGCDYHGPRKRTSDDA